MSETSVHRYRTHKCNELRSEHVGQTVRLSGWVHRKRDHGNLLFVDIRDHYGVTQVVAEQGEACFAQLEGARPESVITVSGKVELRDDANVNSKVDTGSVELRAAEVTQLSDCKTLPFQVASEIVPPEEQRLTYRFLDLRRERMHKNVILRSAIASSLRRRMTEMGFLELQTPILTASSPEGARDFLVPSRIYPGKFFALPQAPQMFKQLFMVGGFDRYFQIAACFRDEDARADRSPGEFYQLDIEMAFVTQEDVFAAVEPLMQGVFKEFSDWPITEGAFPQIPYRESMLKYGTDKPDLRNPLELCDVTELFRGSDFRAFAGAVEAGAVVRALRAPKVADRPRKFFDTLITFSKTLGAPGLAYIVLGEKPKGPLAKFLDPARLEKIQAAAGAEQGDAIFFVCGDAHEAAGWGSGVRTELGERLGLIDKEQFKFCWITDFPMFEKNKETGKVDFSHNPFSMPQGELEALNTKDPLDILAYQYDIVCNGTELSSGAIRNHRPDIMVKAFELAGYTQADVEEQFGALFNAFQYGAPPHGGLAPGLDRIVMLLAKETGIREIIAFPLAQNAKDLMMGAPSEVDEAALRDVHIRVKMPPTEAEKATKAE